MAALVQAARDEALDQLKEYLNPQAARDEALNALKEFLKVLFMF